MMPQNLPPDQQLQQINLQRQQSLVDALRQQSLQQTPNEVVGGRVVPQGIAPGLLKLFQGVAGHQMQGDVDQKQSAMIDALRGKRTDWINSMPKATQQMGTDGMGPPQTIQPTPEQNMQWALQGGEIDPALMNAGMGMLNQNENRAQREDLAKQASADRLGTQQATAQAALERQREALAAQAEMKRQHDETLKAMKAAGGSGGNPFYNFIGTPQGIAVGNARTGELSYGNVGGSAVVKSSDSPELQGKIAGAKTGAQAQATRDFNMGGVSDLIGQAEGVLKGTIAPTHSMVGNALDTAGTLIGASPKGAEQADQLRALGGALVAKMPRMEGPQSDKDVQLYREMAGNVGNANIPLSRRLAALDQVKKIAAKYDKTAPQRRASDQGAIMRFDSQGNPL